MVLGWSVSWEGRVGGRGGGRERGRRRGVVALEEEFLVFAFVSFVWCLCLLTFRRR